MDEPDLPISLVLLIGRHIFDGASPEQLSQMHGVSLDAVNQAWFNCRERLSRHFAQLEEREYKLLNDNDLQARLHPTLQLLLEWRDQELQRERFAQAEVRSQETSTDISFEDERTDDGRSEDTH